MYHVLNRGVGRRTLFDKDADYLAFERVIDETLRTRPMRIGAYCLMPNHWHLVLWPQQDGDLPAFMQQLTNTHVKRWKQHRQEIGHGHLYQGRYKCFPLQTDQHFYDVVRYVERNPLRANRVTLAEEWLWSSASRIARPIVAGTLRVPSAVSRPDPANTLRVPPAQRFSILAEWPLPRPSDWITIVNQPQSEAELAALRKCADRGRPFGDANWTDSTARVLGIESTLRARGRPRQRV